MSDPQAQVEKPWSQNKDSNKQLDDVAEKIIAKKLEHADHITNMDTELHDVKTEIAQNQERYKDISIGSCVRHFFDTQIGYTLHTLPDTNDNKIGILATDLWVYSCIISLYDALITTEINNNSTITADELKQKISAIDVSTLIQLKNALEVHKVVLSADEQDTLNALIAQDTHWNINILAWEYCDVHYPQILAHSLKWIQKKVDEYYQNFAWKLLNQTTNFATSVWQKTKELGWQALDRAQNNPLKTWGLALVWWVALYKFVQWRNTDEPEDADISLPPETKQQYDTHMKTGKKLRRQGKKDLALDQFGEALDTWYNNKEATKWMSKCTGWFWNSKLWSFLKWIGIAWWVVLWWTWLWQLYQKYYKEEHDPDTQSALNNEQAVWIAFEKLDDTTKVAYNQCGNNINERYRSLYTPQDPKIIWETATLWVHLDKQSGALPYIIDQSTDTIWEIISSKQIFYLCLENDVATLTDTLTNMIGGKLGSMVQWLLSTCGFGYAGKWVWEWLKNAIHKRLDNANNLAQIQLVFRKCIKTITYLNYAQNTRIKSHIDQQIKTWTKIQKKSGEWYEDVKIPTDDKLYHELLDDIEKNVSSYKIWDKEAIVFQQDFGNKKIKDIDFTTIKTEDIYLYNNDIQTIQEEYKKKQEKIYADLEKNQTNTLDELKKDCENQLVKWRRTMLKNKLPPLYFAEIFGTTFNADSTKDILQEKWWFDVLIQWFVSQFESAKTKSVSEAKSVIDQYLMSLQELELWTDATLEISQENGNLTLNLVWAIKWYGTSMITAFQAVKNGAGRTKAGGIWTLIVWGSILPGTAWWLSRKLLTYGILKPLSFVWGNLYRHILKPWWALAWNTMTQVVKSWAKASLSKVWLLPSWMRSPVTTQAQNAINNTIPALESAWQQIATTWQVSAQTAWQLQKSLPILKSIAKYTPAIGEVVVWLMEASGNHHEAEEIRKINNAKADIQTSETYFDLSVSAVSAVIMTIGIANSRNPVWWWILAVWWATQWIKALWNTYFDTKAEFYTNQAEYQQMNIGRLKQSIVEHLYDYDTKSKNIARETKFVEHINYFVDPTRDKETIAMTSIDQALQVLVSADEFGITNISASKLQQEHWPIQSVIQSRIQYRINYIKEKIWYVSWDVWTSLQYYLKQNQWIWWLDILLTESRIFACAKTDSNFVGWWQWSNEKKSPDINQSYQAFLQQKLHDQCEQFDNMERLFVKYPYSIAQIMTTLCAYKEYLINNRPEWYEKVLEKVSYLEQYRYYKTLWRSPEQYPPISSDPKQFELIMNQTDHLIQHLETENTDLSVITIPQTVLDSNPNLASLYTMQDITEKLCLSDKPGQNILYQIAHTQLWYRGSNELTELKTFYKVADKTTNGIYYDGKKWILNRNRSFWAHGIGNELWIDIQLWWDQELWWNTLGDKILQTINNNGSVIDSRNNGIDAERQKQYKHIIETEQRYTTPANKQKIKKEIVSYIQTHQWTADTYVQLPVELIIKWVKAWYGNVWWYVYQYKDNTLNAIGKIWSDYDTTEKIVPIHNITYLWADKSIPNT
jgi:hypothetical protein